MKIERASRAEVPALVDLHAHCLPGSILTALGEDGLHRYYDMVVGSLREHVLAALDEDDAVVAGCVLSLEPGSILRRFAMGAPVAVARELARGAVTTGEVRRRLARRGVEAVRGAFRRGDVPAGVPEVTQIFTDPAMRGRGVGAALLGAAEDVLRARGMRTYCIHTLRDDNDAGIRFYRREGFTVTGTSTSFGDHYLVMTKGLS